MRGRYAPSPTGYLHLGNARTALIAWLKARSSNSAFVLRLEDLDRARCKAEYSRANLAELSYLGLDWDEGPDIAGPYGPYIQSRRDSFYQEALKQLGNTGKLFECYLSRKDLSDLASAPHGHLGRYGKRERQLNEKLKAQKQPEKTPSLRFRVDTPQVAFTDGFMGKQGFEVGDFIVYRADGEWAYQLAVVVDDSHMAIEEVVRGSDLLESSSAQILLYQALKLQAPAFFHVPLLYDETGTRMAKRKGSLTLSHLRAKGISAEKVLGFLAFSLGLSPVLTALSLSELLEDFSTTKLAKEPFSLNQEHLAFLGLT